MISVRRMKEELGKTASAWKRAARIVRPPDEALHGNDPILAFAADAGKDHATDMVASVLYDLVSLCDSAFYASETDRRNLAMDKLEVRVCVMAGMYVPADVLRRRCACHYQQNM